ncbi:hypothetical protein [Halobacillus karajensis]|uniref:Uncharacterized protein n=1 Tax=Halobacillus karajensis TaxID=195088 RepID=A0A059NUY8_9BACI|nr:hypothetical protein [Halobacillus karajensis]CDQ22624.1 hypothetical protein BN983_00837 [Halobacillus karajensis]CDQ26106.1 hypothetical protein BN981_00317 [Halobacillus karajensis]
MDKKVNRIVKLAKLWKGNQSVGEQVSSHLQANKMIAKLTGETDEDVLDKIFFALVFGDEYFTIKEEKDITPAKNALSKMGFNTSLKNCNDGFELHIA